MIFGLCEVTNTLTEDLMQFHSLLKCNSFMASSLLHTQLSQFRTSSQGAQAYSPSPEQPAPCVGLSWPQEDKKCTAARNTLLWNAVWSGKCPLRTKSGQQCNLTCWKTLCCNCTLGSPASRFHPACWRWATEIPGKEKIRLATVNYCFNSNKCLSNQQ